MPVTPFRGGSGLVLAALWAALTSACGSIAAGPERAPVPPSPARPTAGAPPGAGATNVLNGDLASDFLATACRAAPGPEFARAWLAHEDRHRRFYDAIYYEAPEARDARGKLAEELGPRRDEMCGQVRAFLLGAPGVIAALRPRVAELVGQAPRAPVYFAAALQWTDGRTATLDGQRILVLNARHQEFSSTAGLAMLVAHELIHDAQSAARAPSDESLSPLAYSLYSEGGATFGVQLLFPEASERAYMMRPDQLERAAMMTPLAARDLLAQLRATDGRPGLRRFFEGGYPDVVLAPRSGYYLGCEIYRSLSKRIGATAAVRMAPKAFLAQAQGELQALSQRPVEAVTPPVEIESLQQLRNAFVGKAAGSGLTLPSLPALAEQAGRSIVCDLQAPRALWLGRWDDASPALRELLLRISGDGAVARRLFDALFRWLAVPHQLAHAFHTLPAQVEAHRAATERLATDVAVAFLRDLPGARRPLIALAPLLLEVKDKLPSLPIVPSEDDLNRQFDRDHDAIARDPGLYLAYRVHFLLESYRRLHRIDFKQTLQGVASAR